MNRPSQFPPIHERIGEPSLWSKIIVTFAYGLVAFAVGYFAAEFFGRGLF